MMNDNVHTNFGLNMSIRSEDIWQKNKFCRKSRAVTLLQICEKKAFTIPT